MSDRNRELTAPEYRRRAAKCMEVAERTSLHAHRDLMLQMAQQWLELARKAEEEEP